jgi:hypothetical protein
LIAGALYLHPRSAAEKKKNDRKNQPDYEQNPCDVCGSACNSRESENTGNQCDDKKDYSPSKHDSSPFNKYFLKYSYLPKPFHENPAKAVVKYFPCHSMR